MVFEQLNKSGRDIESASFQIIEQEVAQLDFAYDFKSPEWEVTRRVIHTTGDFEYKNILYFHRDAVNAAIKAIKSACNIFVDVEMIAAGINKKRKDYFANNVYSFITDNELDIFDQHLRDSLSLVDDRSYENYIARYIQNITSLIKGEKI
ncbi:MAG: precorrin-8X methylmutase, partial [Oligoflexia bacterium]|nr:precorrin-8X methylmutase [Oligoflexia bacterium]